MATKPKAREPARKGKGKAEDPKQAERFIDAARQIGADETGDEFERAANRLLPVKRPKRNSD